MTLESTSQNPTARAAAPEKGSRERGAAVVPLIVAAVILLTAAWALTLSYFVWSLLEAAV